MKPYKQIFEGLEETLKKQSTLTEKEFERNFDEYKKYETRRLSDDKYYNLLVKIAFYSGFRAETVTKKMNVIEKHFPNYKMVAKYDKRKIKHILNDKNMIKNQRKVDACVENAREFQNIVQEHGSFKKYINSFNPKKSFENLMIFKEEIGYKFDYLGGITTYHFMMDIGLPVLKPDRVITRIFKRIGLIESDEQRIKSITEGRKFSQKTNLPIRYIDIVLVKYGQNGKDKYFGLENGICLEKHPKCELCGIRNHCNYYLNKSR